MPVKAAPSRPRVKLIVIKDRIWTTLPATERVQDSMKSISKRFTGMLKHDDHLREATLWRVSLDGIPEFTEQTEDWFLPGTELLWTVMGILHSFVLFESTAETNKWT